MQKQYVLRECDCIDYGQAMQAIDIIHKQLLKNPAWAKYGIDTGIELGF